SGAGNGPFGLGWSLSLPSISRKTDKGLPRYADKEESDVFLLSGAEDLVPELAFDGKDWGPPPPLTGNDGADEFDVRRYRPRIEGLFSRIEQWTNKKTLDVHWRSWTKDNVATIYGQDPGARVADPADPRRVFQWLIQETRDDRGNVTRYDYKGETSDG